VPVPAPLVELENVIKPYGGLRPLRLRHLTVGAGDRVGVAGVDQTTAEVFVNLVTGATVPDEGVIRVFGRPTTDIVDSTDWLATVDRFGIVSERVVLLDQYSLAQNIAMSLTLDLDPLLEEVRRDIEAIGGEVGLSPDDLARPVQDAGTALRHRVRLARAIAAGPSTLLVEHPAAGLTSEEVTRLAADLSRVASARHLAVIVLSANADLGRPFVERLLILNAATGELTEERRGVLKRLFGR
jgi:ABC-type transporter Mla maintaining outer membrane lipid asymmetry ATPase subunit MlaF